MSFLLTPLLWRAINHPPTGHPVFWRTVRRSASDIHYNEQANMNLIDKLSVAYLMLFIGAMLLTNMLDLAVQSAALAFLLLLLALPIILPVALLLRITLLSGSYFGALWAMGISQSLARERTNSTFDLLALLPSGGLAGAWAISAGCLYRQHSFTHVLDLRIILLRMVMLGGLGIILSELLGNSTEKFAHVLLLGAQTLMALAALHIDYIHSTILAVLVGITVPVHTLTEVRLWAASGFLFLQVTAYTVTLLTGVVILPAIIPAAHLGIPAITLVVFFAIREAMITVFWRRLLYLTNTKGADAARVFSLAR